NLYMYILPCKQVFCYAKTEIHPPLISGLRPSRNGSRGVLSVNLDKKYNSLLSKDLGAVGGLLFEIGIARLVLKENHELVLQQLAKRDKTNKKRHTEVINDVIENNDHTEMQYHLAKLGNSLGYRVWIARNDHKREWNSRKLGELSLPYLDLHNIPSLVKDTISLIDVLWLDDNDRIISAFEVEKSTSIYSGILRLYDLALSMDGDCKLYLVAPDKREKEIKAQLLRPSFQHDRMCSISYILFSDLRCHCDGMCKFGANASVVDKIAISI
ncbi:MAG: hypothetical protein ACE3JN_03575, partial [Ectobacillus sp.]